MGSVHIERLIDWEQVGRMVRGVGRRVELAQRLALHTGEPFLDPAFANSGLSWVTEREHVPARIQERSELRPRVRTHAGWHSPEHKVVGILYHIDGT